MSSVRIYPLHLGTITRPKVLFYYNFSELFNMIEVPLIAWYIDHPEKKILVDTGGIDPEQAAHMAPYQRESDQTINQALQRIGVGCEEIDIVINTHLHWDHCGGNGLFPEAEFIVQHAELESAKNPPPVYAGAYLTDVLEKTPFTLVDGEKKITDGVELIPTPGHTEGSQVVLVNSEHKRYVICGDAVGRYENIEADPPVSSGIFVNLRDSYAGLEKIKNLDAECLPGHDSKVLEKAYYE